MAVLEEARPMRRPWQGTRMRLPSRRWLTPGHAAPRFVVSQRQVLSVEQPFPQDGQLLFIEHVRSASPRLAAWQDRLAGPWQRFAEGCRCNRATLELIGAGDLEIGELREASWRGMPGIFRPLVAGRARRS
jgi:hypothetical protein